MDEILQYQGRPNVILSCRAIIGDGSGSVLFLQRNHESEQGGQWELPGGKVGEDETVREAVIRETYEECGQIINPTDAFLVEKRTIPDGKHAGKLYVATAWHAFCMEYNITRSGEHIDEKILKNEDAKNKLDLTGTTRKILDYMMRPVVLG